ncbi:MAG: GAF domain-containing sensor histidine kinase, partial [Candidatus Gastranaerophilales bacterium]|nr:GAF domain-containing sensor histidine kinase [Candidatus Gastranaerophilales bacterium]
IYTYKSGTDRIVIFRDITSEYSLNNLNSKYLLLQKKYEAAEKSTEKFLKLQEHSQNQVIKMGIINRISLIIRETNDIEKILSSALNEIHTLLGSFKTYFSVKEKGGFRVKYCVIPDIDFTGSLINFGNEITEDIRNKNLSVTACIKEYVNSDCILPKGVKRVIIPVFNNNKLLGIIVTLTKQKFQTEDNREILQSISVQLASSIIQAGLIQQLNKKNKKLEKLLKDLKETQLQLINSEKMASLGQLISGIAHEINTPLASISSNNTLINKMLASETQNKEVLNELVSINIEAAKRISDIVKSLKRFVRLDEAEFQLADINKEIDLTLKMLTHELKNNIEVVKNYSDLPLILCSANMLNQVFMNLLVNACHSINDKGENGKIIITTSIQNDNLIIKIKDTGTGIPEKIRNKVFNVGFTTKKIGLGTGLGLAISKKIIELHKGNITFTTEDNKGTEFTVSIPVNKI